MVAQSRRRVLRVEGSTETVEGLDDVIEGENKRKKLARSTLNEQLLSV